MEASRKSEALSRDRSVQVENKTTTPEGNCGERRYTPDVKTTEGLPSAHVGLSFLLGEGKGVDAALATGLPELAALTPPQAKVKGRVSPDTSLTHFCLLNCHFTQLYP